MKEITMKLDGAHVYRDVMYSGGVLYGLYGKSTTVERGGIYMSPDGRLVNVYQLVGDKCEVLYEDGSTDIISKYGLLPFKEIQ